MKELAMGLTETRTYSFEGESEAGGCNQVPNPILRRCLAPTSFTRGKNEMVGVSRRLERGG